MAPIEHALSACLQIYIFLLISIVKIKPKKVIDTNAWNFFDTSTVTSYYTKVG